MLIATVKLEQALKDANAPASAANGPVIVSVERDVFSVRLADAARARLDLSDLRCSVELVRNWPLPVQSRLIWQFSQVSIACNDLAVLADRWEETGEPPVLDIIGLRLDPAECDGRHRTHGLAAFVGYEMAARYTLPGDSELAARTLARLARNVLMCGAIAKGTSSVGLNGRYHLLQHNEHPDENGIMVTILL